MKKLLVVAILALSAVSAFAQVEEGKSYLKVYGGYTNTTSNASDASAKSGFVGGALFEYALGDNVSLGFGANYAKKQINFCGSGYDLDAELNYITVPIIARYYIAGGLSVYTGGELSYLVSDDTKGTGQLMKHNKFNVGIPVGVGFEFSNFVLEAQYSASVTGFRKDMDNSNITNPKIHGFQVTLGYKFSL